jgi:magnesium-transporting ATPase (P-type)
MKGARVSQQEQIIHTAETDAALQILKTDMHGLSVEEAAQRLEKYGLNKLPDVKRAGPLTRFLRQFHNVLIYVLLISAAVTALMGHFVDMAVILAVVLINALIGFLQEGRAEKAMEAIRKMLAPAAAVLRGGQRVTLPAEQLVPGDIVLIEAGDKVPADLRLLQAEGLLISEAVLTGESVPVEKETTAVAEKLPLGDRRCMAFKGTMVAGGTGTGVVAATGGATEIGKISDMLAEIQPLVTPLIEKMNRFARYLSAVILIGAALMTLYGTLLRGMEFAELFMVAVGLAVAAIPEGLPAVLTITLAIGVQAMAKRHAIVRRMPAIETLGAVSVICTDKTGTLTHNEMTVATIVTAEADFTVTGEGYAPDGEVMLGGTPIDLAAHETLGFIAEGGVLCNSAVLHQEQDGWFVEGDPMEGALLTMARKCGLQEEELRKRLPRRAAIPFDAKTRYMAVLHETPAGAALLYVKGAPEKILELCGSQRLADGGEAALDKDYWREAVETIAAEGQRVLAVAVKSLPAPQQKITAEEAENNLVLLGLFGLIDPPRDEAVEAVAACRAAGISVKMITGDHAVTATAIARQVGLEYPDHVLTGHDLDAMDDETLSRAVLETDVFARTSPAHKLRLVKALQAHQMVVAMTGDGVNDAPALKRADVGIAMGRKGSEAAKEAAAIVLSDDNFASIAAAVREGRTVYDNLKKVIGWTLPTNAGESLVIVGAVFSGLTLPLTALQILWINLVTDTALGMALAFEPTEENTMKRPPRPRTEALLSGGLVWQIVFVSVLFAGGIWGIFLYGESRGHNLDLCRTMVVNALVVMEIAYLFFFRNLYGTSLTWKAVLGTPPVWIAVILVTAGQFLLTYTPVMQGVFGTESVPLQDGAVIICTGAVLLFIMEFEKQVRLRIFNRVKRKRDRQK